MAIDNIYIIYGMAWSGALQVEKAKGENGCIPTVYSAGTPRKKDHLANILGMCHSPDVYM